MPEAFQLPVYLQDLLADVEAEFVPDLQEEPRSVPRAAATGSSAAAFVNEINLALGTTTLTAGAELSNTDGCCIADGDEGAAAGRKPPPRRLPALQRRAAAWRLHHQILAAERDKQVPQSQLVGVQRGPLGRIMARSTYKKAGGGGGDAGAHGLVDQIWQRKMKAFLLENSDGSTYFGVGDFFGFSKTSRRKKPKFGRYLYMDEVKGRVLSPVNEAVEEALSVFADPKRFMETKAEWQDLTTDFENLQWERVCAISQIDDKLWWWCNKTRHHMLVKDRADYALLWDGIEQHDARKVSALLIAEQFEDRPHDRRALRKKAKAWDGQTGSKDSGHAIRKKAPAITVFSDADVTAQKSTPSIASPKHRLFVPRSVPDQPIATACSGHAAGPRRKLVLGGNESSLCDISLVASDFDV